MHSPCHIGFVSDVLMPHDSDCGPCHLVLFGEVSHKAVRVVIDNVLKYDKLGCHDNVLLLKIFLVTINNMFLSEASMSQKLASSESQQLAARAMNMVCVYIFCVRLISTTFMLFTFDKKKGRIKILITLYVIILGYHHC